MSEFVIDFRTKRTIDLDDPVAVRSGMDELQVDIATIRTQLETARAAVKAGGEYSDPVWFAKAKSALRFKGVAHQKLQVRLGELNKAKRRGGATRFETRFIDIARRKLTPEVFRAIMAEAHDGEDGKC